MTLGLFVISLLLSACVAPQPGSLSDEQVTQVAETILQAIISGDHASFVSSFTDEMKTLSPADEFENLRTLLSESSGQYTGTKTGPALSNLQGYAAYDFSCQFEKETVTMRVTFKIGGDKVEGLFFDSPNLRQTQK
jgi:hypothetical protein